MKKILGIILALSIIFSMTATLAFGAGGVVSLSEITSLPGNEVELILSISENPGLIAAVIEVEYDSDNLTLKAVSDKGNLGNENHSDDYTLSEYLISWYNPLATEDYTYNGDLATLTFEIQEGAEEGDYPVFVTVKEAYNSNLKSVALNTEDGKITVREKLDFEGITLEDKSFVYDGTAKSLEIEGTVPVETEVTYVNNEAIDVGEKTVTVTLTKEGYNDLELSAKIEITPKDIEAIGIEVKDKIYDGTTVAEYEGGSLKGVVAEDDVTLVLGETGTFENADAGKNKAVTIASSLDGADKDNYNLIMPELKGEITKKEISVKTLNLDDNTVEFNGVLEEDADKVSINFSLIQLELLEKFNETRTRVEVKNIRLTGDKNENYELNKNTFITSISNEKTALITVEADKGGQVKGEGRYLLGEKVTLNAVPKSGYKFVRWEIDEESVGTSRTYEFNATEDLEIKAVFKKNSGGGGGSISVPSDDDDKFIIGGNTTSVAPAPVTPAPVEPTPVAPAPTEQPSELTAPRERKPEKEIVLTIGQKDAVVFGEKKTNDVSAVIKNSRTMLPIRFISEALKAEVLWDNEKREVKVVRDDVEIVIVIDAATATVNGKVVELDSHAFIENDRTYLPVRFISESLGADVYWEGTTQSVIIQVK